MTRKTDMDQNQTGDQSPEVRVRDTKVLVLANEVNKEIYYLAWDTPITNSHLLICDRCFRILKGSKMQSLDSDKRCC